MALVKPKRIQAVKVPGSVSSTGSSSVVGVRNTAGFSGSTPRTTQPAAPAAPTLAQAPTPAVQPPPMPSLQTTADRNQARNDYGNTVTDVNTQLRQLAAQYGGAPSVIQYGYDPTSGADTQTDLGVTPDSPGSTLEVLARNLAATKRNVDETNNANGTFFGSYRLGQLGDADTQYAGDTAAAQRAYDAAVGQLVSAITQARGTRNSNLSQADINDILASVSATPEAQQSAPASAPAPANTIKTVNGVNITPQNWISNTRTNANGNEVRTYADGHQEVFDPKTRTWKYVRR